MAEQGISLVERQRCAIEFCVRLGKSGSQTIQLIHQAYGDDAMRRAAVFKWWKRFRDGGTKGVDWIHLARDRDKWLALMNTVMNLRVS